MIKYTMKITDNQYNKNILNHINANLRAKSHAEVQKSHGNSKISHGK